MQPILQVQFLDNATALFEIVANETKPLTNRICINKILDRPHA